jgi:hypothetical protein
MNFSVFVDLELRNWWAGEVCVCRDLHLDKLLYKLREAFSLPIRVCLEVSANVPIES